MRDVAPYGSKTPHLTPAGRVAPCERRGPPRTKSGAHTCRVVQPCSAITKPSRGNGAFPVRFASLIALSHARTCYFTRTLQLDFPWATLFLTKEVRFSWEARMPYVCANRECLANAAKDTAKCEEGTKQIRTSVPQVARSRRGADTTHMHMVLSN